MHRKLVLFSTLLLLSSGSGLGETPQQQVASPRSTRTLGSFFGYGRDAGGGGVVQQGQIPQDVVKPLVYQVRYYDGKVAQQGVQQVVEKVGVGVVDGVQQGKVQQYYGVAPGIVPVGGGGNYIYVQVPYPVSPQYQGAVQGVGYPYGGQYPQTGAYPCPVEYVYVYDGNYNVNRQRPGVGQVQPGQGIVSPGVVQPVSVQGVQQQQGSPVTYTNRVRPPQFTPGQIQPVPNQQVVNQQQQQQVPGVGVGVVPYPSVYDYYYGNGGQFGYYPGVQQQQAPYYPHYYNPVVSPSSDFYYFVQKPVGVVGDKGQGQGVQNQQVQSQVNPTEVTKKQE